MDVDATIALLVINLTRLGTIAQTSVRSHPVVFSLSLSVTHLIEPEIMGVLQKRDEGLLKKRKRGMCGAVAVLNPPRVPGRSFHQSVPERCVKHGEILIIGIWTEHAPR